MNESTDSVDPANLSRSVMTSFLQIAALCILVLWCFSIVAPFLGIVTWGLIIAVTLHPAHLRLSRSLGGKEKRSALLFVLVGLTLLIAPTAYLLESSLDSARDVATRLRSGSLVVPPPDPGVADWPVVGRAVHELWTDASVNLQETLHRFDSQLAAVGEKMLLNLGAGAIAILQFVLAIVVAGLFLVRGDSGYRVSCAIAKRIVPRRGQKLVDLSIATVRSVTKGVLGVALVQTAAALVGLVLMDVPAAGLWGFAVLVLAVMQLPPWLVLLPVSLWVFSVADTVPATVFLVYEMIVSMSDMFLKPLFLGRGVDVPMPVILVGAIGGAMSSGVIGLFVGAVVLAIGYQILVTSIEENADEAGETSADRGTV
jgi:predicted PurR-regulated permease PerM